MTDEFDIADPEGNLTTVDFEHVAGASAEEDFPLCGSSRLQAAP